MRLRITLASLGSLALLFAYPPHKPSAQEVRFPTISGTATAKDGDSLMFGPVEVRLHGIDAPEIDQQCKDAEGKDWLCGRDARDALGDLVRGREVRCEIREVDQRNRPIGRCSTNEFV